MTDGPSCMFCQARLEGDRRLADGPTRCPACDDLEDRYAARYPGEPVPTATMWLGYFARNGFRLGDEAAIAARGPRPPRPVSVLGAPAPAHPAGPSPRDPTRYEDGERDRIVDAGVPVCPVHRMIHNPPRDCSVHPRTGPGAVSDLELLQRRQRDAVRFPAPPPAVVTSIEDIPAEGSAIGELLADVALDTDMASMHNTSGPPVPPANTQPHQEATMTTIDTTATAASSTPVPPPVTPAPQAGPYSGTAAPTAPPATSAIAVPPPAPMPLADLPRMDRRMTIAELDEHVALVHDLVKKHLKPGIHYGIIPGTDKYSLLKPGAEKLGLVFRLVPKYTVTERDLPMPGHREVSVVCDLFHITGVHHGQGVGSCSTMESKYRYRSAPRSCPVCGKAAVIKGKKDFGGGWLCWKKKDGCGTNWPDGSPEATSFEKHADRMENPDLADTYNTVLKMAKKRALVDASIQACAASDILTQDVADPEEAHDDAFRPGDRAAALADERAAAEGGGRQPAAAARPAQPAASPAGNGENVASDKQRNWIDSLAEQRGTTTERLMRDRNWLNGDGTVATLTRQMASTLINELTRPAAAGQGGAR